jgi:hypothetical protein
MTFRRIAQQISLKGPTMNQHFRQAACFAAKHQMGKGNKK